MENIFVCNAGGAEGQAGANWKSKTAMTAKIQINRAPVLTLWAAVVAERMGFNQREDGIWIVPRDQPPEVARQKEHTVVAAHYANILEFDALPLDTQKRIEEFVRQRAPLFALSSSGNAVFRMECVALMVQWKKEGKLS